MLLQLSNSEQRAREPHDNPTSKPGMSSDRPEAERALAVQFVGCFEGWSLVTVACDHHPFWMRGELASILGVAPRKLSAALDERWPEGAPSDTLVELVGGDRRELLEKFDRAHVVLGRAQRDSIVMFGPAAIDELCARFDSVVARRLRAYVREQIVPEFHAWERGTRSLEQPIRSIDEATIVGNRLEFERRCFEAAVLERLLDRLDEAGMIDGDLLAAHRVVASEIALGGWLEDYRELLAHGWSTPTQIAERWCGMSPMRVGNIIAHLGLEGSRAHSRAFLDKAIGSDRTVICHIYSPAAVGLIERELGSRGYLRCDAHELIDGRES